MPIFAESATTRDAAPPEGDLAAALRVADLRVLVMSLYHATGDE